MLLVKRIRTVFYTIFILLSTASGFWDSKTALVGQFPYNALISLIDDSGSPFSWCNGALLSDQWVITAGACVTYDGPFKIELGAYNFNDPSEDGRISDMTSKKYFATNATAIDSSMRLEVALLKLSQKIDFTDKIQPVYLPPTSQIIDGTVIPTPLRSYEQRPAYASGWMALDKDSKALQSIEMQIISNSECDNLLKNGQVHNGSLCAIGDDHGRTAIKGVCYEDIGAPLVLQVDHLQRNRTLVGIHIFTPMKCPQTKPQKFARITAWLEWIKNVTGIE